MTRWYTNTDPTLPEDLRGRLAVANARLIHAAYRQMLTSDRWRDLADGGATPQRVLWASTGVKNPQMADTFYVSALAAPDTVNTMPEATMLAFADHGRVSGSMPDDIDDAVTTLDTIRAAGVDVERVGADLLTQGLNAFAGSFTRLLENLAGKVNTLRSDRPGPLVRLGPIADANRAALEDLAVRNAPRRVWCRDNTLWQDDPTEVTNRLGWLDCPSHLEEKVAELDDFVSGVRSDGITNVLLLGMGGSSLFPEVLARTYRPRPDYPALRVLDTTDPAAVRRAADELPADRTLYIASSKSGGTLETRSHLEFFWDHAGQRAESFCVITDPGSELA
ncbi:MAG: transaldolase family protein, partial [Acidimicrobiales bacterium]